MADTRPNMMAEVPRNTTHSDDVLLSVVITSYTTERLRDIFELLDALHEQTYPCIETVFVGERDRDLCDEVRRYAEEAAIPNMTVVFNHGEPGLSSARNLGIKHARGHIVGFLDDDALPSPRWAEEMVRTHEDNTVAGVTGPAYPLWQDESMARWFPKEFSWILGCTTWFDCNEIRDVRSVWGTTMSFKRSALDAAGYFSTSIGGIQGNKLHGEEVELSLRVKRQTGKRIVYNPSVGVSHKTYRHRLSTRFVAKTSYWIGYTRHLLKGLYPRDSEGQRLLETEHKLAKDILTRTFPGIIGGAFGDPISAGRKLRVVTTSLPFVAVGYCSHMLSAAINRPKD